MNYNEYDFKFAKTILHEMDMLKEVSPHSADTLSKIKNDLYIYRRVISSPIWIIGFKD